MNTKNKSLKENFGYLFEEEEAKSGESSGQKLTVTFDEELLNSVEAPNGVLALCLSIDFLLLKQAGESTAEKSFLNNDLSLAQTYQKMISQKSQFIEIFKSMTTDSMAKKLFELYVEGINILSDEYTFIRLIENNITIMKNQYTKYIGQALNKFSSNSINFAKVYEFFNTHIATISSLSRQQTSAKQSSVVESDTRELCIAIIDGVLEGDDVGSIKGNKLSIKPNNPVTINNSTITEFLISYDNEGDYLVDAILDDGSKQESIKVAKSDLHTIKDKLDVLMKPIASTDTSRKESDEEAGEEIGETGISREDLNNLLNSLKTSGKYEVEGRSLAAAALDEEKAVLIDVDPSAVNDQGTIANLSPENCKVSLFDKSTGESSEIKDNSLLELTHDFFDTTVPNDKKEEISKELKADEVALSEEQQTQVDQLASEDPEVVNKNAVDSWESLVGSDLVKNLDNHFYSSNPLEKTLTKGFKTNQLDFEKIKQNENEEIEKFREYLQKNMNAISTSAIKSEISNVYQGEIRGLWEQTFKGKRLDEQAFEAAFISTCMSAYDALARGGKSLSEGLLKKAGILLGGAGLLYGMFWLASSYVAAKVALSTFSLIMSSWTIAKYKKAQKAYKKDPISYIESLFNDKKYVVITANLIKSLSADSLIELACPTYEGKTNRTSQYSASASKFKQDETSQKEVYAKLSPAQKNNAKALHKKSIDAMRKVKYFEKGLITISMLNYVFDEFMFGKEGIDEKARNILLSGDDKQIKELFKDKTTQEQLTEKLTKIFKDKTGLESKFIQWSKSYNLKMRKEKSHIKQRGFRGSSQMVSIMGEKFPGFSVLRSRSMMNKEYFEHMIKELTGISRESVKESKALDTQSLAHLDAQAAKDARGGKNENRYYNMSLASLLFENENADGGQRSQEEQEEESQDIGFGQGNELGVEDPNESMTPRGDVDLTQGPEAPGIGETAAAVTPFIPLFFLPWFYKTKTIAGISAKNVWHYAHNPAMSASLQKGHQDIIHTMFEWKGKIYTFYYYSEAALAGKAESLSLIITNTTQDAAAALAQAHSGAAAAGGTAVLGKATALTDSDMVYHGSKLVAWLRVATAKGGRLDGAIQWAEKKGTVKLVGGKLIGAGTPDFLKVLANITTSLKATTSATEKKAILVKASVGAFSYTNAEIFTTSSPDTVPKLFTGISDMMANVDPSLSQVDTLKLTTEYAGQILQSAGIKISGPMPSFGEGFQQGMNAGDYFNQYWSKLSAGQSEQWIQKTTKAIVKLTGQDAQEGLNLGVMQSKIPGTAGFQYKDIDWTSLGVSMLSLAAIAALIYRTAEGRRNYGAVNSNRFLRILNMPRFAAWDFFCSLFGQNNSSDYQSPDQDTTNARISGGDESSYDIGGQSVTEPVFDTDPLLTDEQRGFEPSFDPTPISSEERPQQTDGHVREAYHKLRMSDFLFEGVKTRNEALKDKDSVRLAHQRLQSQFRNMFK